MVTEKRAEMSDNAALAWRRELPKMVVALFLAFSAFGLTVPVLPGLVTGPLGGSSFEVGLAFAVNAVVALLTRPYAGQLAQRLGTRPVMVLGCLLPLRPIKGWLVASQYVNRAQEAGTSALWDQLHGRTSEEGAGNFDD